MNEERSRKSGNRQQRLSLNRLEFIMKEQIPPNVSNMVSLPRLSILLRHVVKQSFACLSFRLCERSWICLERQLLSSSTPHHHHHRCTGLTICRHSMVDDDDGGLRAEGGRFLCCQVALHVLGYKAGLSCCLTSTVLSRITQLLERVDCNATYLECNQSRRE
jgi:hypothetical protein